MKGRYIKNCSKYKYDNFNPCIEFLQQRGVIIDGVKLYRQFYRLMSFLKSESQIKFFENYKLHEKWTVFFKYRSKKLFFIISENLPILFLYSVYICAFILMRNSLFSLTNKGLYLKCSFILIYPVHFCKWQPSSYYSITNLNIMDDKMFVKYSAVQLYIIPR